MNTSKSSNSSVISRRFFLKTSVIAAFPLLQGCPLLLRFFLGRAMVRGLFRGASRGGRRSVGTIGRGMAATARFYRIANNLQRIQQAQIMDLENRHIASLVADRKLIKCIYEDTKDTLMATRIEDDRFFHVDISGFSAGMSHQIHDDKTTHYDIENSYVGHDRYHDRDGIVEHFDSRDNKIGESRTHLDKNKNVVFADDALTQTLDAIKGSPIISCEAANKEYKEYKKYRKMCALDNDENACDFAKISQSRLLNLMNSACGKK